VRAGDLVISPGHGWDEHLGFERGPALEPFPLVFYAGALGAASLTVELATRVTRARAAGRRVLLVRMLDDGDPMGWKELRRFGITPANAGRLLPAGARVPLGDGVEELAP
jgi:hypothetical protein